MHISTETISILANFATIDKGLLIKPGNVLQTRTEAIFAQATVAEEFPREAGITDLSRFLSALDLFTAPNIDFGPDKMTITETAEGRKQAQVVWAYAGEELVTLPMRRKLIEQKVSIPFTLSDEDWSKLKKAVAVVQKPEIKLVSDGNTVQIATEDHRDKQGHSYALQLTAEPNGVTCHQLFYFKNLLLMRGDYRGKVTPLFTEFHHQTLPLTYIVAPEPDHSTFGDN